jgi:peptidoglycan/xylan/chitin deacetylase (PgdA/CDA1 family)
MSPHGIMFHHFCDNRTHVRGQGAINENEFEKILDHLKDYNILKANIWLEKAISNKLNDNDICLTFDDGLKCQFDVALPVLDRRKITAFWFVYSNVFQGHMGRLEIYRYYRTAFYQDIEEFYKVFFKFILNSQYNQLIENHVKDINFSEHLSEYSFYSLNDRKFRFIRDKILGPQKYFNLMDQMIKKDDVDIEQINKYLWMDTKSLQILNEKDHIIGLHSYSHPTELNSLTKKDQKKEYQMNFDHIKNILKTKPITMSHPCNSYNNDTIGILDELGIKIGFRSNFDLTNFSKYEFPRIDHSTLIKELELNSI